MNKSIYKTDLMIVQKIFAHYREPVFNELKKKYTLTVVHSKDDSGIKQIETDYSVIAGKIGLGAHTRLYLKMVPILFKYRPRVVIHEFTMGIISMINVIILSKVLKYKLVLWSHGYNRKKGFNPAKSIGDKLRLLYIKISDALLLYGESDKEMLSKYVDKNKIFTAKNTFDTGALLKIYDELAAKGKDKVKQDKKVKFKYNLIFIGRLIKSKQPELLLKIYELLKDKLNNDIGIHYIGDGESKKSLMDEVKNKNYSDNFFFQGAVYEDDKIGELLFLSDMMVLPGECGLSVVHAFSFSCPVVTYESDIYGPYHGPEIDYVINNKTGYLVKKDDPEKMAEVIYTYLKDNNLQKEFKINIIAMVKNDLSLNSMVSGISNCVEYCMAKIK